VNLLAYETLAVDASSLTSIPGLFIVKNTPLERLLFDRNMLGSDFRLAALSASRMMIRHVVDELNAGVFSELVLLSKGLTYQLAEGSILEGGPNLACNLMATSRANVTGSTAQIDVSYCQLDAGGDRLIIGDTVASGSTVIAALTKYMERHSLREIIILSFAGALQGAARISQFCIDNDIECRMLFGLAAFGMGDNGFDLSFLHPDTVTDSAYIERARVQFAGRPVSAVGWDFGSQSMSPQKYRELCWLEAEMWDLHGHPSLAQELEPESLERVRQEYSAFNLKIARP